MAKDKGKNNIKKTASTLNSKWLQNTLKSMGVAGTEMIKDIMPATSETFSSAKQVATEAIDTVKQTRVGAESLARNIKNSSTVKMGQDFFKNAIEDIKSGNLYNTEREASFGDLDDGMDTDTMFGDMDDFSFSDDGETPDVKVINQEVNQGVGGQATIKAIERGTEYNVRATKATVDTMVSIASTNIMNVNKIGTEVISQLSNINTNLAALIEYNNTNMTKFIDASIGYYEQMSRPSSDSDYGNQRITADELFGSSGGLDFRNYKEYIKSNIKELKDSSMVGSTLNMILENKDMIIGGLVANPIGTILKSSMKAIVPQVTKTAMAALDESMKDFIPVMLERIGSLDEINGPFSGVAQAISKVLGIKTKRKDDFDLSKIEKGPMPYNGMANHTIVEIIPKYLRESNAYLREIAEAITGKNNEDITANSSGFDWETGTFKNLDEMRAKVYDEIQARTTSEFRNSKFGEKMASQRDLLKSAKDRENYDNALDQLYTMIERHEGAIDFKNKDHMNEIMGGVNASDSIKNLMESYIEHLQETSDAAIGNAISTKQKATREKNRAMKDVERSASERGVYQFASDKSYDAYIDNKYKGSPNATIDSDKKSTSKANVSVPTLLQGIQNTLNRGIYVQIKNKLDDKGSSSSDDSDSSGGSGRKKRRRRKKINAIVSSNEPQSKDEFKTAFEEADNVDAELANFDEDSSSVMDRFGRSSAKQIGAFKGVLDGIMAGNSDKAFEEFMNGMRSKFRQAGEFLSENFFTPIKKHLFGEKNEDGYIQGGIFGGVNNRMKESFYSLRRMITGKGYVDAEGNRIEDANDEEMKNTVAGKLKGMLSGLKEGLQEKLFGKKAEAEGEEDSEGLLPKAKRKLGNGVSSLLKGLTGWKHALFGKSDDEDDDPEKEGKKTWEQIKKQAEDVLPSALVGSMTGAAGGAIAGGYLGTLVGGPIGGALLGLAGGIASRSDKFKDWLFGPEDSEGKRVGGVVSEKVQDYVKENGKYLAAGGAIGLAKNVLTNNAGGFLGTLVGGPLAGAILGIGSSMLVRSQMFQKFLFGDEKTGQLGLVKTVKSWFGGLGKNKSGDPSGGKLAGMMGVGAGVGAITIGTITNSGILGLALGPAGPIGGAIVGLGAAILAQKNNFKEWLFGKVDPETGEKREGVLGKFKNMLTVTVFNPIKNTISDVGRRFKTFFYYDVLSKFNLIIEPIGKAVFGGISKMTGHAIDSLSGLGDVIKEDFLKPAIDKAKTLLTPIVGAVNTVTKGIYKVGTTIIKAPINLLYGIVSPIGQAVAKTVKGAVGVVNATIKYAVVAPIKNLVVKPLVGAVGLATKIITKPFEIVGNLVSTVSEKISAFATHTKIFLHNIGQDFKDWIFNKNPVAKGLKSAAKKVKDFGARIKNTFKILVNPLTDFVKSSLTEVKNHLIAGVSKFFSALNPINWIKGIYNLLTGGKKKDKDPTKMGYLRRAWWKAGQDGFGINAAPAGMSENGSYAKRRKELELQKKFGRQHVYYYSEDGTRYTESKNGKYYEVTNPDGSNGGMISASELPDKSTLTKHVDGVETELDDKEKKAFDDARLRNQNKIAKATGWQKYKDTAENRELAKAMASKKGKVLTFDNIETEDAAIKMREARLQQDTLDATEDIKDNTYESSSVLKRILDTVTFGFTMSPEERKKLREHKQIIKKKAAFLSGYDGAQSREDAEKARQEAEELAKHQAETLGSDAYNDANRKRRKKTDNKYSRMRQRKNGSNFVNHGFFGGLAANFNNLKGYWKAGLDTIWKDGETPDEVNEEETSQNDATVDDGNDVPKHATGTRHAKRGPAIVGENGPEAMYRNGKSTGRIVGMNGPEVLNMQGGETIIPNNKLGGNPSDPERSNLSDDNISRTRDSRKLGIGERILKELLSIKDNTAASQQEITINGDGHSDYDDSDEEYSTTNLRRLGRGIKHGFSGLVNRLPGAGLIRKGAHIVGGTAIAGKTIVGSGVELFKMAKGKTRKGLRAIRKFGRGDKRHRRSWFGHNAPSSDSGESGSDDSGDGDGDGSSDASISESNIDTQHEEQQAKEDDAQASVSTLTAENRQKKLAEQEEIDNDNAREDAILNSVENIEETQKEHAGLWKTIFSKKGLITSALMVAGSLVMKFISGLIKNGLGVFNPVVDFAKAVKDGITDWWKGLKDDARFGWNNRGDGKSTKDKIIENAKRLGSVYDSDGNVDHQTGARKKLRDKLLMSGIATRFGRNADGIIDEESKRRGSNNLLAWGKEKLPFLKKKTADAAVETTAKDATEKAAKEGVENAVDDGLKAAAKETADATIETTAETTAKDATEKAAKKAGKKGAKKGAKKSSTVVQVTKHKPGTKGIRATAKKAAKEGVENAVDDGLKAAAKETADATIETTAKAVAKEGMENAVETGVKTAVKEGVEVGVSKTASDKSLWTKVIDMIKGAFTAIRDKVIKKEGGSKVAAAAIKSAPDDAMKTVGKCEKHFSKVSGKIASILGVTAGLGATVVGLAAKEGTWIAVGALNGLTGAARLFRVDNPDNLMTVISGVIGALSGTTVGSIIDVINELVVSVTGLDLLSQFATLIYSGIMRVSGNEEAADALREAQDEFQQKFEKDKTASLKDQYKTMKSAGLINASVTEEQFIQGAQEGKYGAHIQSFADYNDDQHQTMGAKINKATRGSVNELKRTFIGEKKVSYTDKKGNEYKKNADGTYQVTSKDGKDLGFVGKDAIPEDAVENVEKVDGVLVKLGKSIIKLVTPFIKMGGAILPTLIGDLGYIVSGQPFELLKNKAKIDDKTPYAGLAKAITFIPKLTGFVPAVNHWIGKKLLGFVGPILDTAFGAIGDLTTEISNDIGAAMSGDIAGVWKQGFHVDDSGILTPITATLGLGSKLAITPITAVSWVGHKIWDNLENIASAGWSMIKTNFDLYEYIPKGDLSGLWSAKPELDEENPLSPIVKILSYGTKVGITPITAVSWVGHKIWNGIKYIGNGIKTDWDNFGKHCDAVVDEGMAGHPGKAWMVELKTSDADILSPVYEFASTVVKIFGSLLGVAMWVPGKVKKMAEKAIEVKDEVVDWFEEKKDWFAGKLGFGDDDDKGGSGKGIGGSGDGTNDRPATITDIDNIPNAPKSTYYSQNDPRWASTKFVQSDGTDDGATIGNTGCGPTAMAMAVSDATGKEVTPVEMAKVAQETGDRDETGVNWNFIDNAASRYNVGTEQVQSPSGATIRSRVAQGNPVILLGQDSSGSESSPYTRKGHYVVATGVDSSGNITINDPRGVDHSISIPSDELATGTVSMWTISAKPNGIFPRKPKRLKTLRGGRGNEYMTWLQTDSRWGSKKLGSSGETMAQSGCAVTSVAILAAYSGSIDDKDFNPGWLCDYLNANNGFDSQGCINWNIAPGMTHSGKGTFQSPSKTLVVDTIRGLMEKDYVVTLCVNNGSHYVAIVAVGEDDNTLMMSDPAQNEVTDVFEKYNASSCDSYHYFKGSKTAIELPKIKSDGTFSDTAGAVVNKAKEIISPIQTVSSAFAKYATALFNAVLTGNYDIDWAAVFADENAEEASSDDATTDESSGNPNYNGTVSVAGTENSEKIWSLLRIQHGLSPAGAAAVMGNWEQESGLNPGILESTFVKGGTNEIPPGYTSEEYVKMINEGKYSRDKFMTDAEHVPLYVKNCGKPVGAGFGLAQWTSGKRKGALWDALIGKGLGIDSIPGQVRFAYDEISKHESLLDKLKTGSDVDSLTKEFLTDFEGGDPSTETAALSKRQQFAEDIYKKYADKQLSVKQCNSASDNRAYYGVTTDAQLTGGYTFTDDDIKQLEEIASWKGYTGPVSRASDLELAEKGSSNAVNERLHRAELWYTQRKREMPDEIAEAIKNHVTPTVFVQKVKDSMNTAVKNDDAWGAYVKSNGGKYNNAVINNKRFADELNEIRARKAAAKEGSVEEYNLNNYFDSNGESKSNKSTATILDLAENGDQDAIKELCRRAAGASDDSTRTYGEKIDDIAFNWVKSAALAGNATASAEIMDIVASDTDGLTPFTDEDKLTNAEWEQIKKNNKNAFSAANKESVTRMLMFDAGMLALAGSPLVHGATTTTKAGEYAAKGLTNFGSYGLKTASFAAGLIPVVGAPIKGALDKTGEFADNMDISDAGAVLATTTATGGGALMYQALAKDDSQAYKDAITSKESYTGFDYNKYFAEGGKYGGRGEGPSPTKNNGSTYYSQNDPRWARNKFVQSDGTDDGATIADSGCGPTAMAMALSDATGETVKPTEMARLAQITGDRDETGTNWNFINNAANYYGVNSLQANNPDRTFIENSLKTGSPVILSGQSDGDVNSPYTASGHYVVATGLDSNNNVLINDPRGTRYSKPVNIDKLINSTGAAWLIGSKNKQIHPYIQVNKTYIRRGGRGGVTAADVITVAKNEIGYLEKAPGTANGQLDDKTGNANTGASGSERTKYYQDLGLGNGGYWCAAFASWCIWAAAGKDKSKTNELMCGGVSASCNQIISQFKSKNRWYTDRPALGDLIMFNWADSGDALADHVGIVYKIDATYVYTIEGNSSNPDGGADGVFEHQYELGDSEIMGYCRPGYEGEPNFDGQIADATVSDTSTNDSSSMFSKVGNAIFKAGVTDNWDINWDEVLAGATLTGSDVATSSSSSSTSTGVASNEAVSGKEIKVPRDVQDGLTENYSNYDYWYDRWGDSSNQRLIADAWAKKGRKQDKGIAMLDGKYLCAVAPKFGTTGDLIKVKLEDGETFNAILGDAKGTDATSEWGHITSSGKADIIEWEACLGAESDRGIGFDGIHLEGNWKGKYVDSITNGGSYMDKIKGGSGTGRKSRGGRGSSAPSLNKTKYSNNYYSGSTTDTNGITSVEVRGTTNAAMNSSQRDIVRNTTSYSDDNLEKLMKEVINILGVISNNSGNLSLLNDIKSGLSSGNNTIVSNTNNTTVNANGKSNSKKTSRIKNGMSRNEEAARKIAFGR